MRKLNGLAEAAIATEPTRAMASDRRFRRGFVRLASHGMACSSICRDIVEVTVIPPPGRELGGEDAGHRLWSVAGAMGGRLEICG